VTFRALLLLAVLWGVLTNAYDIPLPVSLMGSFVLGVMYSWR
jgi:hypothetical protein